MGNFEGGHERDHCPSLAWSSHSKRDEAITLHYIQVVHIPESKTQTAIIYSNKDMMT